MIACSGIGPERARVAAQELIARGATSLLSWGTAGGLDPELSPGDLLIPSGVCAEGGAFWPCETTWRDRIVRCLGVECVARVGVQFASETVVSSLLDKRRLFEEGAIGVDMESAAIAIVAARARLPFLVIRTVCDPANCEIPKSALVALDGEGQFMLWNFVLSLLSHPADLSGLLQLRRGLRSARATLARVLDLCGGLEGLQAGECPPQA